MKKIKRAYPDMRSETLPPSAINTLYPVDRPVDVSRDTGKRAASFATRLQTVGPEDVGQEFLCERRFPFASKQPPRCEGTIEDSNGGWSVLLTRVNRMLANVLAASNAAAVEFHGAGRRCPVRIRRYKR